MKMRKSGRKTIIGTIGAVLLLAAALFPLSVKMDAGRVISTSDDMQRRITLMHVRQALRMERESGSAVAPMMDIEDAWAIEDARSEAQQPLVWEMHSGDDELGFDAASNTFYCSIGSSLESWPELALTLRGEAGVQAAWIDDYTYDFCADAVQEGYRYELISYTDEEYAYFGVVFTGLPVVTLHVEDAAELGETYIPARVSIAGAGYEAIDTAALTHLRGGGFDKGIDKPSYRVEFHRLSDKGKDKKNRLSVLGMDDDSDWLLVSNAGDASCVHNELAFELWNRWNSGDEAFARLESRMVEVFVQDEYMGLYQLLQRIDEEDELEENGDPYTDAAARLIGMRFETGRPVSEMALPIGGCLELRYAPPGRGTEETFARFADYVTLNLPDGDENRLDDEAFSALALGRVDVRELMSYYLYMNVCSLPYDNVKNNVFIWARQTAQGDRYTLSPWDMDSGFAPLFTDGMESVNMWMTLPVRMLELDVGGSRAALWAVYEEMRASLLTDDAIYQWIQDKEDEINASGAYLRETERWRGGAESLSLADVSAHTLSQMSVIERHMREMWPIAEDDEGAAKN